MLNTKLIFFLFLVVSNVNFAQSHLKPDVAFRSKDNPYYWKNKTPHPGYWQQDVHYTINAQLDDSLEMIDGKVQLVYWNNSPHILTELFFHLHQNASLPGSYYHKLNLQNKVKVKFGANETKGFGTVIDSLSVRGFATTPQIDNTVMRVPLELALQPGDSLVIKMNFKTYFDKEGNLRRRMKEFVTAGTKHFDGVQWYPAIAVFDHKFGWETDQDLDKEYYGDFGTFDVRLTFPQEYVVEATGVLQNQQEVLPDTLRKKLDLSNFAKTTPGSSISVPTPRVPGKTKTWYFHAKNVHNFAFTADPLYRIGELQWNGIKVIALAQEPHAAGWQQSALFTLNIIRLYSMDFGMYAWPKIIVADAKDGMEYPMLTLDNGTYPQHQSLLAHEVGHMWFYGMVGNNETYRASLDEGFTQFLTVWSMDKFFGKKRARYHPDKYISKHLDSSDTRYENLYYPYLNHVTEGFDEPLNTHSSGFNGAIRHSGNYGLVYYKTGTMLYNLMYVLGEELFLNAMKHYVEKWKFAHPYPEDFREAIIEYSRTDLNWFFDQWLETTKYIDYAITKVSQGTTAGEYNITFRRKGRMQMPIDFVVTDSKGFTYNYHIPNTWFVKKTSATVLPKWYGWDLLQPEYTATVNIAGKLNTVEIDPQHLLADADLSNNKKGQGGISTWQLDHRVPGVTSWTESRNYWRPDVWYNSYDGIQAGLHVQGEYFNKYSYTATAWYNTRLLQDNVYASTKNSNQPFAVSLGARMRTNRFWHNSFSYQFLSFNAGLARGGLGLEKIFRTQDNKNPRFSKLLFEIKYLANTRQIYDYLLYPNLWGPAPEFGLGYTQNTFVNGSITAGYSRHYVYTAGFGDVTLSARVPSLFSDYNYSYLALNSINRFNYKKFEIRSRVFAQYLIGEVPLESALYLAGAHPEQLVENKFTRARGFVPASWLGFGTGTNHFHQGGGLNLRGYTGYLAPETAEGGVLAYRGNGGIAYNLEIDFDRYIKIPAKGITKNFKLDTYLFGDIGSISYPRFSGNRRLGAIRADAGIGTALTFKFGMLDIKPMTVRFDMPLFLNTPPATSDYFDFRFVVGVNRAF